MPFTSATPPTGSTWELDTTPANPVANSQDNIAQPTTAYTAPPAIGTGTDISPLGPNPSLPYGNSSSTEQRPGNWSCPEPIFSPPGHFIHHNFRSRPSTPRPTYRLPLPRNEDEPVTAPSNHQPSQEQPTTRFNIPLPPSQLQYRPIPMFTGDNSYPRQPTTWSHPDPQPLGFNDQSAASPQYEVAAGAVPTPPPHETAVATMQTSTRQALTAIVAAIMARIPEPQGLDEQQTTPQQQEVAAAAVPTPPQYEAEGVLTPIYTEETVDDLLAVIMASAPPPEGFNEQQSTPPPQQELDEQELDEQEVATTVIPTDRVYPRGTAYGGRARVFHRNSMATTEHPLSTVASNRGGVNMSGEAPLRHAWVADGMPLGEPSPIHVPKQRPSQERLEMAHKKAKQKARVNEMARNMKSLGDMMMLPNAAGMKEQVDWMMSRAWGIPNRVMASGSNGGVKPSIPSYIRR